MIGKKLRFMILERDGFRCQYCGKSYRAAELHVDHVNPKSRGGSDHHTNLVTACIDCNLGKGALLITRDNKPVPLPSIDWPQDIEDPVFFTNGEWAATGFGLECLECYYPIPADSFRVKIYDSRGTWYQWPVHMAEKSWVNVEKFLEAYFRAIDSHAVEIDDAIMEDTLTQVSRLARERQHYVRINAFRKSIEDEDLGLDEEGDQDDGPIDWSDDYAG